MKVCERVEVECKKKKKKKKKKRFPLSSLLPFGSLVSVKENTERKRKKGERKKKKIRIEHKPN